MIEQIRHRRVETVQGYVRRTNLLKGMQTGRFSRSQGCLRPNPDSHGRTSLPLIRAADYSS